MRARTFLLACTALLLSARGTRYQASEDCRHQLGPRPDNGAMMFGLVGALAADAQPEVQTWDHAMHQCVDAGVGAEAQK